MPVFTIEAPDGRKIKVEADTPELAMQGAQEAYAQKGSGRSVEDLQKDLSAGKVRFSDLPKGDQEAIARAERGTVDSGVRSLARGLPFIGTLSDEINSRINAAAGGYLGGSQAGSYDERVTDNLAYERAKDRTFNEDHPVADTALNIVGGVGGTVAALPLVAAAGVAGAVGRTALGVGAKTLPGAIGRGMIAGGLQGAAAGAGEAEDGFVNRSVGAIKGGTVGTVAGGLIPAVFEGGRRAVSAAANKVLGNGDALSGLSSGARRYVGQIATPDNVNGWQDDLQRLGPDAMLADVSPEWQMVARGAAARPGSRETVVGALNARDAVKNQRLASDLDASIGKAIVPSEVEASLKGARDALGPQYDRVLQNAKPVDTRALAAQLDGRLKGLRGESRAAVSKVRDWLNVPGTKSLDADASALHQVRQEIDGLLEKETNSKVVRELTAARKEIDDLLAKAVPGIKDIDAQFHDLSRQSEALKRGSQVLDSGKTAPRPQEVVKEVAEYAQPHGTLAGPSQSPARYQQGARAEIDRIAGQNINDPIALRRYVKGEGDWSRDNMRTVFGQDRADDALGAIDRQAQFRDTFNRVTSGSDTAPTRAFQEGIDRAESPFFGGLSGGAGGDLTMLGASIKIAKNIGGILNSELGKARANRFATELARVSVAQGVTRDEFIAAMRRAGVRQQTIGKALDYATRTGLIVSREAPTLAIGQQEPATP